MLRYLTTAVLLFFAVTASQAQPGGGGPVPGDPTAAPIDGGASILLASGVAYTIRKVQQRRRKTA